MEQMLECLLVRMRGIQKLVEAGHEKIKAHQERTKAMMEACLEQKGWRPTSKNWEPVKKRYRTRQNTVTGHHTEASMSLHTQTT
jgi:hypothetical protein